MTEVGTSPDVGGSERESRRYAVPRDTAYVTAEEDRFAAPETAYLAKLPGGPLVVLEGSAWLLFGVLAAAPDGARGSQVLATAREAAGDLLGPDEVAAQVWAFLDEMVGLGLIEERRGS